MSMISEQIRHLRTLQEAMRLDNKLGRVKCDGSFLENRIKIIDDAIDTIETLSAKIQANNFNNGWIPCEDRLPNEIGTYLVQMVDSKGRNDFYIALFNMTFMYIENDYYGMTVPNVVAWMPLPKGYKESD